MKIQNSCKGAAKNKLFWFVLKGVFIERGHSTSHLMLSTFEK